MGRILINITLILLSIPSFSQMGGFFGTQQNNVHPNNFPGVIHVYIFSYIPVQADNTAVVSVADQSGNGNTLTQGTSGSRGTYQTNEINGLPILQLDGTDDHYLFTNSVASTLPAMEFLVFKKTATTNLFPTLGTDDASTHPYMLFSFSDNRWYSWSRGNGFIDTDVLNDYDQFVYATFLAKGSNGDLYYRNGVLQTSNINGGTGGTTAYPQVFKRLTDYANGKIAALIICNAELSTQNRQAIELFLKNTFGL